jgi:hypothetical protein
MGVISDSVRNNRCTRRLVVVVCTSPLLVLYLATFNKVTKLPRTLRDHSVWYPVDDAEPANSILLPPLETEPRQGFAQWVNMRRLHVVNADSVCDVRLCWRTGCIKLHQRRSLGSEAFIFPNKPSTTSCSS